MSTIDTLNKAEHKNDEKYLSHLILLSYDTRDSKKHNTDTVREWIVANIINLKGFDIDCVAKTTLHFYVYLELLDNDTYCTKPVYTIFDFLKNDADHIIQFITDLAVYSEGGNIIYEMSDEYEDNNIDEVIQRVAKDRETLDFYLDVDRILNPEKSKKL